MTKRPFLWALKQVKNRLPSILLMTLAQVGNAIFAVLFALGTRGVIDSVQLSDRQAFLQACIWQGLIIAAILICLCVQRHLRDRLHADLERDWKRRLLHGLLHGDYASVSAYHSGELLNRLNNDVNRVNDGILNIIPNAAAMITRLIAALIVLGALDVWFALIIVVLGVVVIVATALMRRWLKDLNKQVNQQDGKVSSFLQEIMEKLLMVQTMNVSKEVERRADVLLNERYVIQRKRKNVSLATNMGISAMYHVAGFFALVWCAGRMLMGQMSFGSLTAVIQLVNQLQTPFVNLTGIVPQYVATVASAERLMELEKLQGVPDVDNEDLCALYEAMDAICADDVCFSYDRDRILEKASFVIPKGSFCAITGSSGIGKSTLLKLLLGVFKLESGEIYLQSGNTKLPMNRSMCRIFAYVPQGNLLLSGTVRENLMIVRPGATEEEIQQAIYVSAMDEYLGQLPDGLNTMLGESGAGLSEGQAQRLAIARAILGGAPVLLLDESTSALDDQTEKTVLQRIRELKDRTCIAVTHRSAAMELCEWRLDIQEGQIVVRRSNTASIL